MPYPENPSETPPSARGRVLRLIVGLFVLVGVVVAMVAASGGIAEAAQAVVAMSPSWLVLAALAEVISYGTTALLLRQLARPLGFWEATLVALVLMGLGNLIPGTPAPGLMIASREIRSSGSTRHETRIALALFAWFTTRTFLIFTAAALTFSAIYRRIPVEHVDTALAAAGAIVAVLALMVIPLFSPKVAGWTGAAVAQIRLRGTSAEASTSGREAGQSLRKDILSAAGNPRQRFGKMILALASWISDAACLWMCVKALGIAVDPLALGLAYVLGMVVASLPVLPGGMGLVEAGVPALLHLFGVPLAEALAATLVWRALALYLPGNAAGVWLGIRRRTRRRRGA